MNDVFFYLISGIVLGLSAGISPGPLLTLVISETLRYDIKEGIKISLAPILTDFPIIILTIFIISKIAHFNIFLGIISFMGGCYLFFLGYESFKTQEVNIDIEKIKPNSIKKGIITNFLNPSPYIFWFTVGAPMSVKAYRINILAVVLFIGFFYIFIVGIKIIIAYITEKSRSFLRSNIYIYTMRILGGILMVYGILFVVDAIKRIFFK